MQNWFKSQNTNILKQQLVLTVSAAVKLMPSPPARVDNRNTKMSLRFWKSATMSRRAEILLDPSNRMYRCFLCHMYSYCNKQKVNLTLHDSSAWSLFTSSKSMTLVICEYINTRWFCALRRVSRLSRTASFPASDMSVCLSGTMMFDHPALGRHLRIPSSTSSWPSSLSHCSCRICIHCAARLAMLCVINLTSIIYA